MGVLVDTQGVALALLAAAAPLTTVPVISEDKGSIQSQMQQKQLVANPPPGKKGGAVIVVMQAIARTYKSQKQAGPTGVLAFASNQRQRILRLDYTLTVFENWAANRSVNGTGIPALAIAENALAALDLKPNGQTYPAVIGEFGPYFYPDENAILWVPSKDPALIVYHVMVHTFVQVPI